MSRLTWDGTAEPVSRDQILRHARGQGDIFFPVQLTTSRIGNLTRLIHTLLHVMTIHTYIHAYAKRSDVALYTIRSLFLLSTPSSPHCTRKVSEHDSLWQPPAAHSDERPRPQKSSRAQHCLNALTPGYLKSTVVRGHPMVWSLALCPDGVRCGVWRSVPGEGSTYCIHTGGPRSPRSLPFGS